MRLDAVTVTSFVTALSSTPVWPFTSTTDDVEPSVSWLAAVTVTS